MMKICICVVCFILMFCPRITPEKDTRQTERRIKTQYDINGRPINQGQDNKGWHKVSGLTKLSSGKVTITVNTSTVEGRQNVSFLSSLTYRGVAWSLDTTNTKRYWVVPLTGKTFMVKSSDGGDTATVLWKIEGE